MSSVEYQREYYDKYLRASRGYVPKVDRAPVAAHVRTCLDIGMSIQGIADAARVSYETVWRIVQRPEGVVTQAIRGQILAVKPVRPVTRHGLIRRIQALSCLGWTAADVAKEADLNLSTVKRWRRGLIDEPGTGADAIVRAYESMHMRRPTSTARYDRAAATRAISTAQANGWVPPLAWEDDEIDNPYAIPVTSTRRESQADRLVVDEVAVERAINGHPVTLNIPERERAVELLMQRPGVSDRQIAIQLDVWPETVLRIRKRLGIETTYQYGRKVS